MTDDEAAREAARFAVQQDPPFQRAACNPRVVVADGSSSATGEIIRVCGDCDGRGYFWTQTPGAHCIPYSDRKLIELLRQKG